MCGAVNTWLAGINANGTKLNQDVQGVSDLGAGRDLLVKFMQDAVTLTDTMISAVQAAGAPAVASGQQLSADLVQALSPVKQTFEGAVTKAQQLPTNDPQAFSAQIVGSGKRSIASRRASKVSSSRPTIASTV